MSALQTSSHLFMLPFVPTLRAPYSKSVSGSYAPFGEPEKLLGSAHGAASCFASISTQESFASVSLAPNFVTTRYRAHLMAPVGISAELNYEGFECPSMRGVNLSFLARL